MRTGIEVVGGWNVTGNMIRREFLMSAYFCLLKKGMASVVVTGIKSLSALLLLGRGHSWADWTQTKLPMIATDGEFYFRRLASWSALDLSARISSEVIRWGSLTTMMTRE